MIFDTSQQRLRLCVTPEFTRFAWLCRQLYDDILVPRTIHLTVLYRAVSKGVPHKSYLVTFGSVPTNVCSFCGSGVDTL